MADNSVGKDATEFDPLRHDGLNHGVTMEQAGEKLGQLPHKIGDGIVHAVEHAAANASKFVEKNTPYNGLDHGVTMKQAGEKLGQLPHKIGDGIVHAVEHAAANASKFVEKNTPSSTEKAAAEGSFERLGDAGLAIVGDAAKGLKPIKDELVGKLSDKTMPLVHKAAVALKPIKDYLEGSPSSELLNDQQRGKIKTAHNVVHDVNNNAEGIRTDATTGMEVKTASVIKHGLNDAVNALENGYAGAVKTASAIKHGINNTVNALENGFDGAMKNASALLDKDPLVKGVNQGIDNVKALVTNDAIAMKVGLDRLMDNVGLGDDLKGKLQPYLNSNIKAHTSSQESPAPIKDNGPSR